MAVLIVDWAQTEKLDLRILVAVSLQKVIIDGSKVRKTVLNVVQSSRLSKMYSVHASLQQ